ncbi:IS1 family transposase [Candidatus Phycorickettsia trachydisci]|uniref:IS1 family transposase n=1 Tax=Candidatus Phycorickettsia trachydisci TaxID=2115978 RepID=UPI000D13DCA5
MRCRIIPKKQRKIWIWFAFYRATKKFLVIQAGSHGKKALRSLLSKLDRYKIRVFCTDHWKIYRSLIP